MEGKLLELLILAGRQASAGLPTIVDHAHASGGFRPFSGYPEQIAGQHGRHSIWSSKSLLNERFGCCMICGKNIRRFQAAKVRFQR